MQIFACESWAEACSQLSDELEREADKRSKLSILQTGCNRILKQRPEDFDFSLGFSLRFSLGQPSSTTISHHGGPILLGFFPGTSSLSSTG
jgi:hypothetical protein